LLFLKDLKISSQRCEPINPAPPVMKNLTITTIVILLSHKKQPLKYILEAVFTTDYLLNISFKAFAGKNFTFCEAAI
jgi:hypothetical protein